MEDPRGSGFGFVNFFTLPTGAYLVVPGNPGSVTEIYGLETFGARFGLLIKTKRGAEGLTQEALAAAAFGDEARKSRVSEIESGKVANPQQKTVDTLVVALAISADELAECRTPPELPPLLLLENLAMRFGHDNPDAPPEKLAEVLTAKAREWRAWRKRLEALVEADGRIANLVGAAEAALAAGDFDEADARLADAEEMQQTEHTLVQVRKQAKLRGERAAASLLKGDAARAAAHFETAAKMFAPFSVEEGAQLRHSAAIRLRENGLQFGPGIEEAIELHRANLNIWTRERHSLHWAGTQNSLGNALRNCGARLGGRLGTELLDDAVSAYRAALTIYTRDANADDWAMTQNNLGNALLSRGKRQDGLDRVESLREAVLAYQAAAGVTARTSHPMQWAATMNNLGAALFEQGLQSGDREAVLLLGQAVAAFSASLEVRTRTAHPVLWAETQNNLGATFAQLGGKERAAKAARLFGRAAAGFRAALSVTTRDAHPLDWAGSQNNLGLALIEQAARQGNAEGLASLKMAVASFHAAQDVYTRETHPMDWAMTHFNLSIAFGLMGDLVERDAVNNYWNALDAADKALDVYDPVHTPFDHERAAALRSTIAEKLAELG